MTDAQTSVKGPNLSFFKNGDRWIESKKIDLLRAYATVELELSVGYGNVGLEDCELVNFESEEMKFSVEVFFEDVHNGVWSTSSLCSNEGMNSFSFPLFQESSMEFIQGYKMWIKIEQKMHRGEDETVISLTGISMFGTVPLCQGHGNCYSDNYCVCHPGYSGSTCSEWGCNNIDHNDPSVCEGLGNCTQAGVVCFFYFVNNNNQCTCVHGRWSDLGICDMFQCFGLHKLNTEVCSEKGECVDVCNSGYLGAKCDTKTLWTWYSTSWDDFWWLHVLSIVGIVIIFIVGASLVMYMKKYKKKPSEAIKNMWGEFVPCKWISAFVSIFDDFLPSTFSWTISLFKKKKCTGGLIRAIEEFCIPIKEKVRGFDDRIKPALQKVKSAIKITVKGARTEIISNSPPISIEVREKVSNKHVKKLGKKKVLT